MFQTYDTFQRFVGVIQNWTVSGALVAGRSILFILLLSIAGTPTTSVQNS